MNNAFAPKSASPLFSFALAALMTLGLMGGVNVLATHGQSEDALLARAGTLVLAADQAPAQS